MQVKFMLPAHLLLGQLVEVGQTPVEVIYRFIHSVPLGSLLPCCLPVVSRFFVATGTREVVSQQFRPPLGHLWETLRQHLGDAGVVLLPGAAQQRVVRHILHKSVLEDVDGLSGTTDV
jgi:hypothetical protein